jgi:hypothetical protein
MKFVKNGKCYSWTVFEPVDLLYCIDFIWNLTVYIPVYVFFIEAFLPHNDLEFTQPLTEMSTRDISWGGKGGHCIGVATLPPSYANCLEILGATTSWSPKGLSSPVIG